MLTHIVTLAQLAILPRGIMVAHVNIDVHGIAQFDIQGILQVGPLHRLLSVSESWVELSPVLPDVRVVDGRVVTSFCSTTFMLPNTHPHRFVVYADNCLLGTKPRGRRMP